jgi:hypothetical protein
MITIALFLKFPSSQDLIRGEKKREQDQVTHAGSRLECVTGKLSETIQPFNSFILLQETLNKKKKNKVGCDAKKNQS